MAYEGNCGQYDDGIVRPGMVCAGYPEGNRDTCQVRSELRRTVHHIPTEECSCLFLSQLAV